MSSLSLTRLYAIDRGMTRRKSLEHRSTSSSG